MSTFSRAFVQQEGQGRLGAEARRVVEALGRRGIPVTLFHAKDIARRRLPLDRECFVMGDVDCSHGALRQLGITPPTPDDYPECLRPWLRRRVWGATVGDLRRAVNAGAGVPVFAKPAGSLKRFTGRLFAAPFDLAAVHGLSGHAPLWCSEPVEWRAEFRVYVVRSAIVAIDRYDGDENAALDEREVASSLVALDAAGDAPAGYGIDFGVLSTGETALVEKNDGFALGAYAIDAEPYTELLLARWAELMSTPSAGERAG